LVRERALFPREARERRGKAAPPVNR